MLNDYELDKPIEFLSTTRFHHKGVCWLCHINDYYFQGVVIFETLFFIGIGIDVAKHHHDAFILNHSTGEIICEHLHFDNTQKGFHFLIEAVLELEPSSLLSGMEATGHYYQALAHFLSSLGYKVGLLNSLKLIV